MLQVEQGKQRDSGPCPCCGDLTRIVWGYVSRASAPYAVYYARWTRNQAKHGSTWLVSVGDWEDQKPGAEQTPEPNRVRVGLEGRAPQGQLQFMVVDAEQTPWGTAPGLGTALTRNQVVGTPLAGEVFEVIDAALAQDPRLAEVRNLLEGTAPKPQKAWRPARPKKRH